MFSNGLRLIAVVFVSLELPAVARADSAVPDGGAIQAPKAGMYYAVQSSESSRFHRMIDRSEIDSMPELVDNLLDTIARLSNYRKPSIAPRVTKVSRAEIERTICSGPCPVKGWHLPEAGIFLDESLTPETNLVHRSILLHELVHFLQEINGEDATMDECNRWLQREREAYWLQNQYLGFVGNASSYHLIIANESWIASSRNMCVTWRRAANTAQ